MIESYTFGKIKVNGRTYKTDIRISAAGDVIPEWWRKQGHVAEVADVKNIVNEHTRFFVLGRGEPGMMKASPALKQFLEEKNINLIEEKSQKAAEIVNRLHSEGTPFAAGFHLTC